MSDLIRISRSPKKKPPRAEAGLDLNLTRAYTAHGAADERVRLSGFCSLRRARRKATKSRVAVGALAWASKKPLLNCSCATSNHFNLWIETEKGRPQAAHVISRQSVDSFN